MNMNRVWEELDLGRNVSKCLKIIRDLYGIQAGMIAVFTGLMCIGSATLTYFFDIRPTMDATAVVMAFINGNSEVPRLAPWYANLVSLSLTFTPSGMQMVGVMFARDVRSFALIIISLSILDLVTDGPGTTAFLATLPWEQLGVVQYLVYPVAWAFWLFVSSFVFETVTLCLFVITMALILRAMLPARRLASSPSSIDV